MTKLDDFIRDIEKLEVITNSTKDKYFAFLKNSAFPFYQSLIIQLFMYVIASFFYLHFYDVYGFQKTLIILLVGVIVFAIRKNN